MTTEISIQIDVFRRRLERENQTVLRFLRKVRSYRFEPKDYNCFRLLQQLRTELKELSIEQSNMLDTFSSSSSFGGTILEEMQKLSKRHKELEKKMADYLLRFSH